VSEGLTDRYVAFLDAVIPNPSDGPDTVGVDLETGQLLDTELSFGPVPPP
jgi:hypothetical protein